MITKAVLLLSLVTILAGYLVYIPLPPDFVHPWRARTMTLIIHTIQTLASVVATLTGQETSHVVSRWGQSMVMSIPLGMSDIEIRSMEINGLRTKLYRRKGVPGSIPAVMYFHGGGWVLGDIDMEETVTSRLALMTNTTVIAVNYRKAPAQPFPLPFQDCLHATEYVMKHGAELEIDSNQVLVAGTSAGGNLAAAVALKLSSKDPSVVPRLKGQVLLSPALQIMTFNSPSYRHSPPVLTPVPQMIFYWTAYLGIPLNSSILSAMLSDRHVSADVQRSQHGLYVGKGQSVEVEDDYDVNLAKMLDELVVDPFLAPLMADDEMLRVAPPALLVAGGYEQLRDEIAWYADRLKRSGVSTEYHLVKGQMHLPLGLAGVMPSVMDTQDLLEVVEHVADYIVRLVKD